MQHRTATIILCAVSVWITLCLLVRLWLIHRSAPLGKKLVWSVILCVPLLGWLFYGAFFKLPGYTDTPLDDSSYDSNGDHGGGVD